LIKTMKNPIVFSFLKVIQVVVYSGLSQERRGSLFLKVFEAPGYDEQFLPLHGLPLTIGNHHSRVSDFVPVSDSYDVVIPGEVTEITLF
jgi:hypothetical protein